jgi:hypothetical protein
VTTDKELSQDNNKFLSQKKDNNTFVSFSQHNTLFTWREFRCDFSQGGGYRAGSGCNRAGLSAGQHYLQYTRPVSSRPTTISSSSSSLPTPTRPAHPFPLFPSSTGDSSSVDRLRRLRPNATNPPASVLLFADRRAAVLSRCAPSSSAPFRTVSSVPPRRSGTGLIRSYAAKRLFFLC